MDQLWGACHGVYYLTLLEGLCLPTNLKKKGDADMTHRALFDVVLPVWNAPEWVDLCLKALLNESNRNFIAKIIVVDDCSENYTAKLIDQYQKNNPEKFSVIHQSENGGFIKTVNKGLENLSENSQFVLIQNTDCLVPHHFFSRLIKYFEAYPKCGLVCPISNNAANLSIPLSPGFDFLKFDQKIAELFEGDVPYYKACTVVGHSLTISRKCFQKVGKLNEDYGIGYGEETDYQFRAMKLGFEALVAPNIYVYHQGGSSFSQSLQEDHGSHKRKNWEQFMKVWGDIYRPLHRFYLKNDPIKEVKRLLGLSKQLKFDVLFVLPSLKPAIGGMKTIVNLINHMVLNGISAGLLCSSDREVYLDEIFFEPLYFSDYYELSIYDVRAEVLVATSWDSYAPTYFLAKEVKAVLAYYIQGYEPYFFNSVFQGLTIETYRLPSHQLTISQWLKEKLERISNNDIAIHPFGYNPHFYHPSEKTLTTTAGYRILLLVRNNIEKGDFIAKDLLGLLSLSKRDRISQITVISLDKDWILSDEILGSDKIKMICGPLSSTNLREIYQDHHIYIDFSLHEGFGLVPLEFIACGGVVIVSDSGGIKEFITHGQNGIVVPEVNKPEKYLEALDKILQDDQLFERFKQENQKILPRYNSEELMERSANYLLSLKGKQLTSLQLPEEYYRILCHFKVEHIQNRLVLARAFDLTINALGLSKIFRKIISSQKLRRVYSFLRKYLRKLIP